MRTPELPSRTAKTLSRHGYGLAPSFDADLGERRYLVGPVEAGEVAAPVGYVVDHRGLFLAFAQTRPRAVFGFDEVGRHRSFGDAVLAVLANFVE